MSGRGDRPEGPEDEYRPRRASGDEDSAETADTGDGLDEDRSTTILPRVRDDRATTVLPATRDRRRRLPEDADDMDVVGGRFSALGPRTRQLLTAVVVGLVVIGGLVFGYVALRVGQSPSDDPSQGGSSSPTAGGSETPVVAVLDDAAMLNAVGAAKISDAVTWQIASTQRGLDSDSPRPACLTSEVADGQPNPAQTVLRLISGSGKNSPAILHEAQAYETPEDAAQAYAVLTRTVGGCSLAGAYVQSGRAVSGLGDQAAGVVLQFTTGSATQSRSVLVARTGTVVDVVDVAQGGKAAGMKGVATALGDAISVQCTTSGGGCVGDIAVTTAPPPAGGDTPGFLAGGDLPPVGDDPPAWVGDPVHTPDADFGGTQCETVDWSKVDAKERSARTYLQQDSAQNFGVDEFVITTDSAKKAQALVDKVKGDLNSCAERKLTATVAKPRSVDGTGAEEAAIDGWTTTVQQKIGSSSLTYRVGMVAVGPKAVYLFSNPVKNLDFTDGQFDALAVRAGERASQVD